MTTLWDAQTPVGQSNLAGYFSGNRAFNGHVFRQVAQDGQTHQERYMHANAGARPQYMQETGSPAVSRSSSVPLSMNYSWQREFLDHKFLIPPNNTGYMPLWTYDRNEVEAANVHRNLSLGRTQGVSVWRPHPSTRRDDPFNVRQPK